MKILIIGDINSPYIIEQSIWFQKNINIECVDIFPLTSLHDKQNEIVYNKVFDPAKKINHNIVSLFDNSAKEIIFRYIQIESFLDITDFYDIIQIHFVDVFLIALLPYFRSKGKKIVLSIWGSDLLRSTFEQDQIRNILYKNADVITLTKNEYMLQKFITKYPEISINKLKDISYGADIFNHLTDVMNEISKYECKRLLNLNLEKKIITIGYNNFEAQRHLEIIESILNHEGFEEVAANVQFFLPLTYGSTQENRNSIINYFNSKKLDFVYFDKYLNQNQICMIRYASDIFIHLATTDDFCNSLREYMYTKNVVITGEWFPYGELTKQGLYLRRIKSINEVGKELLIVLNNFDEEYTKCRVNDEKLLIYSDWSIIIKKWIKIYDDVLSAN